MAAEWTTADYAFVVSLCSAAISLFSLAWNVWSKFIYPKPRIEVSIAKMMLLHAGESPTHPTIGIHATNFGPGQVTLRNVVAQTKQKGPFSKPTRGFLNPYKAYPNDLSSDGPFSGGLPKKLEVGEEFSTYFPVEPGWFETEQLDMFGYLDTFGRHHWCKHANVRTVRQQVLKKIDES